MELATTLKDKQAVAALLTRFKKLPIMVPTRSVPGNSDTLDVSTTTEVKKPIKSWAQTATAGSSSQGTALTADSTQNTEFRTKRLEDHLTELLNRQNQTDTAMQRLDVTLNQLLSLQEMASLQSQKTQKLWTSWYHKLCAQTVQWILWCMPWLHKVSIQDSVLLITSRKRSTPYADF